MSTNYRINRADVFVSGSTTYTLNSGANSSTGSTGIQITSAWGIMAQSGSTGAITLQGGGLLSGSTLIPGEVYPCYPTSIRVSAGTITVLS
jgi:hypothetical protein